MHAFVRVWTDGANIIIRTLLAPPCPGCNRLLERPLSGPVCDACWQTLADISPPLCAVCGDAINAWSEEPRLCARCRRAPPYFSTARSGGRYHDALQRLIHAFKYDRHRFLAKPLAALLRQQGSDMLVDADAVVPVPLHHWRTFRRGFNQSDDLARELAKPVWRVLRRVRLGTPQAGLQAGRRHANVRGAFVLRHQRPARRADGLSGATVVLIDDVMTTGATVNECSRVLREAGVRDVRVLTVARASAGPHA